jgi:signal transduction histidine kinase
VVSALPPSLSEKFVAKLGKLQGLVRASFDVLVLLCSMDSNPVNQPTDYNQVAGGNDLASNPITSSDTTPLFASPSHTLDPLTRLVDLTQQLYQITHHEDFLANGVTLLQQEFQVDRVTIFQVVSHSLLTIATTESDQANLCLEFPLNPTQLNFYQQGEVLAIAEPSALSDGESREDWIGAMQATLTVPIFLQGSLWGLLQLQRCQADQWQAADVALAKQLGKQLGSAIYQSELYQQLHRVNHDLERKFRARTAQLQLAFDFEATLKRITDKVRDSLDEDQILQSAVRELTLAIGVSGCNAALYDLDQGTSTVCYEYTASVFPSQGRVADMGAFPELYQQLLQGQAFQFCSIIPSPVRGHVAMLACPILDDKRAVGDLWLINHKFYAFSEQDIRLVEQVANQCAIALRQARLYKAAQTQVAELERLNRLKDDFLSTVSHELRTPIASMRMATQMLELTLDRVGLLDTHSPIVRYLQILQSECNREISLVNDLLDLARLDGEKQPLNLTTISLQDWLLTLIQPFLERTEKQQQSLHVTIASNITPLICDVAKLDRVMTELLHNACKYTPPNEEISVTVAQQANHVYLSVSNSGVEIPLKERSRIFERFYRIPNADPWKHGGTGLGLALVKTLVEQLQGEVKVSSHCQKTIFTVQLPLIPTVELPTQR